MNAYLKTCVSNGRLGSGLAPGPGWPPKGASMSLCKSWLASNQWQNRRVCSVSQHRLEGPITGAPFSHR